MEFVHTKLHFHVHDHPLPSQLWTIFLGKKFSFSLHFDACQAAKSLHQYVDIPCSTCIVYVKFKRKKENKITPTSRRIAFPSFVITIPPIGSINIWIKDILLPQVAQFQPTSSQICKFIITTLSTVRFYQLEPSFSELSWHSICTSYQQTPHRRETTKEGEQNQTG